MPTVDVQNRTSYDKSPAGGIVDTQVALLTNFLAPYRLPVFRALADRVRGLQIFLSTPMEPDRNWSAKWDGLSVTVQRNVTLKRTWNHPSGFAQPLYVHVPYDTVWVLSRSRPDVVISGELGLRTLQSMLYSKLRAKGRFIIWATLSDHTEQGRGLFRNRLRRWLVPQADAVLVNGESGARYIRRFGVPDEKIFRVNQAVDVRPYLSVEGSRAADQAHRLLYVGRLIELKGLVPFLSTLSQWAKAHPQRSVELWLAGSGPLRTTLEQFPRPKNLSLRFLGEIPYETLPSVYQQAGILVFPTLSDEWGLVVNEAMAAGLPVLGSMYSQAVEELVVNDVHGWTFRTDQEDHMYASLDRALATPLDKLDQMRKAARDRVRSLTPELMAERILRAIRYVC